MPGSKRSRVRPAIAVSPPALTRHLVFFFPTLTPVTGLASTDAFDQRTAIEFLESYFQTILPYAEKHFGYSGFMSPTYESIKDKLKLSLGSKSSFVIKIGKIGALDIRIQAILYSEHFTISYFVDNRDQLDLKFEAFFENLRKIIPYSQAAILRGEEFKKCDLIFRDIWDHLDGLLSTADIVNSRWIDGIRLDSRGFVLAPDNPISSELPLDGTVDSFETSGLEIGNASVRDMFKAQRSFFKAALGVGLSSHPHTGFDDEVRWDSNHVLCMVMNGAAYYGSNIDLEHESQEKQDSGRITRHFVIIDGVNMDRIGRLVRRLNILAELRALTFVNRRAITGLSNNIRTLSDRVSDLLDTISRPDRPPLSLTAQTASCVKDYNYMGKAFSHGKNNSDGTIGGLFYRINRAEYYFNALTMRLSDLGEGEIRGSQTYSVFVRRNFKQPLESIKSIGDRYSRLGVRMDRLITIMHTLQQRKITMSASMLAAVLSWGTFFNAFQGFFKNKDGIIKENYELFLVFGIPTVISALIIYLTKSYWKWKKIDVSGD